MAYPMSAALTAALLSRTRMRAARVDVLRNGQVILPNLRCTGGSVTVSSSPNDARRKCQITAVDLAGDLVVADPSAVLAPYGDEILIRRGLTIPGLGPQMVPMGLFQIQSSTASYDGGDVTISVSGTDRSALVTSAKFVDYNQVPAGSSVQYALSQILGSSLPTYQAYSYAGVQTAITAQTYAPGDDRWALAQTLAAESGCLLYFSPDGTLVLQPVTDPKNVDPAWTFDTQAAPLITSAQSSYDRAQGYNVVIATAQGSTVTTPLYAIAMDSDPTSPTYVGGPYGQQVLAVSSSTLNTGYDLQQYANTQLLLNKGATQQTQITAVPVPHLDAYDVIAAGVDRLGLSDNFVVDSMSVPVASGTMSITTRGVVVGASS